MTEEERQSVCVCVCVTVSVFVFLFSDLLEAVWLFSLGGAKTMLHQTPIKKKKKKGGLVG